MNIPLSLENAHTVVERFGCWPEFGDDEISEISLDRREATLIFIVNAIQHSEKNCQILFKCKYIKDLSLEGFSHQNVISKIDFKDEEDGSIKVLIESSFGVKLNFSCKTVSVSIFEN